MNNMNMANNEQTCQCGHPLESHGSITAEAWCTAPIAIEHECPCESFTPVAVVPSLDCGERCDHTPFEHDAFDEGFAGKVVHYSDPALREAYESGKSARECQKLYAAPEPARVGGDADASAAKLLERMHFIDDPQITEALSVINEPLDDEPSVGGDAEILSQRDKSLVDGVIKQILGLPDNPTVEIEARWYEYHSRNQPHYDTLALYDLKLLVRFCKELERRLELAEAKNSWYEGVLEKAGFTKEMFVEVIKDARKQEANDDA